MVFLSRDLVALWLAHVDRFGERCIEVSAINVSLLQLPIIAYSDGNDYADGGKFCCRRECFFVVYTFCLGVTLGDKSGLPARYVASCIMFVVEDEVAPHNVCPIRWLDQLPGAHPFVLVELSLNGFAPLGPVFELFDLCHVCWVVSHGLHSSHHRKLKGGIIVIGQCQCGIPSIIIGGLDSTG